MSHPGLPGSALAVSWRRAIPEPTGSGPESPAFAGDRGRAPPAELSLAGDALTAIDDAGAISSTIRVRDFTFSEEA
jgi:hypothetical protein